MSVEAGSELGPWTVDAVDPEKMKMFAIVLDDPNPIHTDPAAAKAAGLGDRVINQGPASFGYVLNMLLDAIPGASISDLRVRLTANVYGGEKVTAAGRVDSVEELERGRSLSCQVWLDVEDGRRALEGTATVTIATRQPRH